MFLGLQSDIRFATWLLDHLTGYVLTELADHLMGDIAVGTPRRKVINGFVDGITGRIAERLSNYASHRQQQAQIVVLWS